MMKLREARSEREIDLSITTCIQQFEEKCFTHLFIPTVFKLSY